MHHRRVSLLTGFALATVVATAAAAGPSETIVDDGMKAANSRSINIRPRDIRTWKSVDQRSLIITTRNHQRYLVELKNRCHNLHGSMSDATLYTDEHYIYNRGAIRIVPRDRLDRLLDQPHTRSVDFAMDMEANSDYCPIERITALGREEKKS